MEDTTTFSAKDKDFMRRALQLARRAQGQTSPNPLVGAVLVRDGKIIGRGWHHRAGEPHAEIEALRSASTRTRDATLYVTLEPCCTHGRTPPCTDAIRAAGITRVVVAATDPNPQHAGRGFDLLRASGIKVESGLLADEAARINEAFNHWIVAHTPFVTVKAAMTLDGKIATASGESKWITGEAARDVGMKLRRDADAVLVGVNTVLTDDPSLTVRIPNSKIKLTKPMRRIILDSNARTPLTAKVLNDTCTALTTLVVTRTAPKSRVRALATKVNVLLAPAQRSQVDVRWLLKKLGAENVTNLLVEGGGEVNAAFLAAHLAQRVVFFYAPKILGGRDARRAVAGDGASQLSDALTLRNLEWRRVGADLLLTARIN